MPALSFLVKPASGDCNLRCKYCFYYTSHTMPGHVQRMSLETLERLVAEACTLSPLQASFAWQGGEPTLAGLEFFRAAVRLQEQYRRPGQRRQPFVITFLRNVAATARALPQVAAPT